MLNGTWQQNISAIFNSTIKLGDEELQGLLSKWNRSLELKRNDFLIEKGQTEGSLFFVLSE